MTDTGRRRTWRRLRARGEFTVSLAFVVALCLVALFADVLERHDPTAQDLRAVLAPISGEHWLGADHLGRDVFSRLVHGSRVAILTSLQAVAISILIGVPAGLFVGYRGGWWDRIAMRIVEAIISLPGIVVAIAVLAVLGPGLTNAMIAIGILFGMSYLRLARGLVLAVREELFIDASKVFGTPERRIIWSHVLPNVAPPLIVQTTLVFGAALLAEAGLSFLGLGVQPPQASWGGMLAEATGYLSRRSFLAIPPGLAIALTVLAFNVLGDTIRDSIGRGIGGVSLRRAAAGSGSAPDEEPSALAAAGEAASTLDTPTANDPAPAAAVVAVPARPDLVATTGPTTAAVSRAAGSGQELDRQHALEVRDLNISFESPLGGHVEAVTGVSFHVSHGETLGLVGESGCGKTITALSILGLLPAAATVQVDRIVVDGTSLVGLDPRGLRRLRGGSAAMIFQDPMSSLDPAFTVGDQLVEAIRLHREVSRRRAREEAEEYLAKVRIPDAARRMAAYPHELSGGMAQRVMIAMALSSKPSLLIADEPTTALDVTVQGQVIDLLRDIQDELSMAILFITHDLGVVADMCDRAAVMYAGEIVEEAAVRRLFSDPQHPYTRRLLASRPDQGDRGTKLESIPGTVPAPGTWDRGCRFRDRCDQATAGCEQPQELVGKGDVSVRCHLAPSRAAEVAR